MEQREIRRAYRDLVARSSEERFEREQRAATQSAPRKSVHFDPPDVLERGMEGIEDDADRFWRQENQEYADYWATHSRQREDPYAATPEWDRLQEDWERFEAGAAGIKPVSVYHFQPNNPYFLGEPSTRNHAVHTQRLESNEVRVLNLAVRLKFTVACRVKSERLGKRGCSTE